MVQKHPAGWQTKQSSKKNLEVTLFKELKYPLSLRGGSQGFAPATMNMASDTLKGKKMKNIEPNETPSCLLLCRHIVFTRQLEILVATLPSFQGPSLVPLRPLPTS